MTKIIKATHEGELKIGKISIPCYVLPDGTRVLSSSGVNKALGGTRGGLKANQTDVRNLPRIFASSSVKPFISRELLACAESRI